MPALLAAACSDGGEAAADLGAHEVLEAVLARPVRATNPFDPAEVDLVAEVEGPGGRRSTVPAFVFLDHARRLEGGFEKVDPVGGLEWRLRFAPDVPGRWRWREVDRKAGQSGPWNELTVGPPAPGRHGPLRVSAADPRYLAHADGAPYFALGENLAWYDGRGTFAYDDWLERLAAEGATYVRLWMPSWAFGLEWTERGPDGEVRASSLGNYEPRLGRAWQLDRVIERCEQLGIQVMLSLQNHGPFSTTANSEWEDNPYNLANGGPLAEPGAFFTDPEADALFRRRLRYVVARWGASPAVGIWELWNEVDLVDPPPGGPAAVAAWHAAMARELAALDPQDRPVTTSLGAGSAIAGLLLGGSRWDALWELPGIDLVQMHLYAVGGVPVDLGWAVPTVLGDLARFGKPVLAAEVGVDFRGPAETLAADPEGAGFHDLLWAGALGGGFGTGMTWWWDEVIDPEDRYFHLGALASFLDGVAFDRQGFVAGGAAAEAPGRSLRAMALRGETTTLVWLKHLGHQWFAPDPSLVEGATVTLEGLGEGPWRGRWVDAYTGETVAEETSRVRDGRLTLAAPPFRRDVALRLDR